jgi:hypothetical protein
LLALLDIVLLFPDMKLESDFVGEDAPEPGSEVGGVGGRLLVAIALGRSFEADRLRKEVLRFLLYRFVTGVFEPLLRAKSRSSIPAFEAYDVSRVAEACA